MDLSDTIGHFSDLFDPASARPGHAAQRNDGPEGSLRPADGSDSPTSPTSGRASWSRPVSPSRTFPSEWEAYWSFWCDQVQPAVRQATGRDDIWGVGLPMSAEAADTENAFDQFMTAYEADYVTPDGRLVIDEPEVRQALVKAIDSYTAIYRKGCTPPDSVTWADIGNNEAFLAQSGRDDAEHVPLDTERAQARAPRRLLQEHRDDRMATRSLGRALPAHGRSSTSRMVFSDGGNTATAKEFVRFLVAEGWLAHYLDFSGERMLPSMPGLLEQPFWLDPSDRHRMAAVMQAASRPRLTTTPRSRATCGTTGIATSASGRRRSTASPPRASAPSRRSTRRSRASKQILSE